MGFRFLPYKKAKKGVQIAGVDYDDSGGGGGSYTLPPATASTLGGIKVGSNLSVESDGTLSGSAPYTLPTASSEVLGGVKVGSGLTISDGVLSTEGGGGLPAVQEGTITVYPSAPLTVHYEWTHLRYRPGVIAEFSFNFTLTSSISGWTKIASLGFPISTINVKDVFVPVYNGDNTQPVSYAQIKQNGDIYLYTTTSGANISIACTLMLD